MSELLGLAPPELAPAFEDPTTGARIVVADDNPTTRLILAGMLTAEGYQVAEASDGIEAQRRAQEGHPALVILDVDMPGLDGFEVCRALRAAVPTGGPAILILTGRNDEAAVTRAFEVGATDFASKAMAPALLLHRVRFLLRNAEAVESLRRSQAALERAQWARW